MNKESAPGVTFAARVVSLCCGFVALRYFEATCQIRFRWPVRCVLLSSDSAGVIFEVGDCLIPNVMYVEHFRILSVGFREEFGTGSGRHV